METKDLTEVIVRELSNVDGIDPTFSITPDRNNIQVSTWKGECFEIEIRKICGE